MRVAGYPLVCQDILATRFAGGTVGRIDGTLEAPPGPRPPDVAALPLVVREPGWVRFEDRFYRLDREGLYRFANWGRVRLDDPDARPVLVDARKSSSAVILFRDDLLTLLGSVAVLTVHGHVHDRLSHEERLGRMKTGSIALTCGSIASFMCRFLADLGFRTRLLRCRRVEGAYDTYDCGHLLFELFWPRLDKWVLADVDVHQLFVKDGVYLDMAEVKELIERGEDFDLSPLTPPGLGVMDTTEPVTSDFIGMALFEHTLIDPVLLKQWHRRMFAGVAIVDGNGESVATCDDRRTRERLERYGDDWRFVPKAEWLGRFYAREAGS